MNTSYVTIIRPTTRPTFMINDDLLLQRIRIHQIFSCLGISSLGRLYFGVQIRVLISSVAVDQDCTGFL